MINIDHLIIHLKNVKLIFFQIVFLKNFVIHKVFRSENTDSSRNDARCRSSERIGYSLDNDEIRNARTSLTMNAKGKVKNHLVGNEKKIMF
jgi:hypothetical protein